MVTEEGRNFGVVRALYLLFNEGYHSLSAPGVVRRELCYEALRLAQTGAFVGSLQYAAPEQFQGGGVDTDRRADLGRHRALAHGVRYARDETFDPNGSAFRAKTVMTDLCGALALAHVLEPSSAWTDKLAATLALWDPWFQATAQAGSVTGIRWQQSAMVQCILALDVIAPDWPAEVRAAQEARLDGIVREWWRNRAQDGTTSTPGITALSGKCPSKCGSLAETFLIPTARSLT